MNLEEFKNIIVSIRREMFVILHVQSYHARCINPENCKISKIKCSKCLFIVYMFDLFYILDDLEIIYDNFETDEYYYDNIESYRKNAIDKLEKLIESVNINENPLHKKLNECFGRLMNYLKMK